MLLFTVSFRCSQSKLRVRSSVTMSPPKVLFLNISSSRSNTNIQNTTQRSKQLKVNATVVARLFQNQTTIKLPILLLILPLFQACNHISFLRYEQRHCKNKITCTIFNTVHSTIHPNMNTLAATLALHVMHNPCLSVWLPCRIGSFILLSSALNRSTFVMFDIWQRELAR